MATGRQGRPQRPVDPTVPALAELARELRGLRAAAGLTLDELSAATHWSKGALSAATTGRDLPRWELVKAWVLACEADANLDLWRARHERARVQHQSTRVILPGPTPALAPAPAPVPAADGPSGGMRSDTAAAGSPLGVAGPGGGPGAAGNGRAVSGVPSVAGGPPATTDTAATAGTAGIAGNTGIASSTGAPGTTGASGTPGAAAAPVAGGLPGPLERDAWRTLAPDRRPWGVNAHPAPIPIRFTTVGPDFTDTGSGADAADLSGRYEQIAEVFALARHPRLLVLGDRGTGKTQLARHLGTRLLTAYDGSRGGGAGAGGGAVPVLVSLRGWRPEHGPDSLLAWIADALTDCTTEDVRTLLGRHRLLPILDDFDSLDPRQRVRALHLFNRLPEQAPFVLVSGWAEFARAVEKTDTVIAGSAGVRLRPVGVGELRGWIQRSSRSRAKEQDWEPVLEALAARPDAPAAAVLADPMLACAARLLYTDGRADPAELIAEDATVESLEIRLVQHLFGALPPYRHHPGRLHEQRRHAALHLLAGREHEEGGPVGDLRVLYRGRRPTRRRAGIQAAVLGLLSWFLLGVGESEAVQGTYASSNQPLPGVAGFVVGALIGFGWYGYLRHRLDERASRADPIGRAGQWLLRAAPAGLALVLALPISGTAAEDSPLLLLAMLPIGIAVWTAEQAVRQADPGWLLADLLFPLLFLLLFLGLASSAGSIGFTLCFLPPVFCWITVNGHWVRAVFASRFALWDLHPGVVRRLLHEATAPDILRVGPRGWSFTHPAVARWYRGAPGLPEGDAGRG
ncbi:helix-turn-helix domain-containing protein [Streptomyces sp. NPDC004244]